MIMSGYDFLKSQVLILMCFYCETSLSDCTCSILDNFHNDFVAFHTSAMEDKISSNIMLGRPFGGTAIMVRI